ncbi:MAG: type II secretion system F family protein [Candidatus Cloacimonetes bacterium]|nr:type II secretion system F family protein [Candidatus Cloacimonadota bacterium]
MPKYKYKSLSKSGEVFSGLMEADTKFEVLQRIKQEGHIPVEVDVHFETNKKLQLGFLSFGKKDKATSSDIYWFTQQFYRMIKSGFTVDRSLDILLKQVKTHALKKLVMDLRIQVQEGKTLSESLAMYPDYFDSYYIHMVEAGEMGGILGECLSQIVNLKDRQAKVQKKLVSAMTYPTIMILTFIVTGAIFLFFIIPEFAVMFKEMNRELPIVTQMVLTVSEVFQTYYLEVFGTLSIAFVVFNFYNRHRLPIIIDGFLLKSYRLTDIYIDFLSERFSRTLGSLLQSGVSLYQSLEIVKKSLDNQLVKDHVSSLQLGLQKGNGLATQLWEAAIFSEIMIQAVHLGEENGKLGEILYQTADQFEENISSNVEVFLSFIEPVMTLGVAVFVVIMILAMVLPMMQAPAMV